MATCLTSELQSAQLRICRIVYFILFSYRDSYFSVQILQAPSSGRLSKVMPVWRHAGVLKLSVRSGDPTSVIPARRTARSEAMQLSCCDGLRGTGSALEKRRGSDKARLLTGKLSVGQLYGPRQNQRRQRLQQLCVRAVQRAPSARQERSSAPKPPLGRASARDSSKGATTRSPTGMRLGVGPVSQGTKPAGDAAGVNNIAPAAVRARAAWRMLGRGLRRDPESVEAAAQDAAARAFSRSNRFTAAAQLTGKPGARSAADAAATAGAALAPLPDLMRRAEGLHKPVGLVLASAHVLFTACSLTGDLNPIP